MVDDIEENINIYVVPDVAQEVPILIGRNFTELSNIIVIKDDVSLKFLRPVENELSKIELEPPNSRTILRIREATTISPSTWGHVLVGSDDYEGEAFVEASIRLREREEYCLHVYLTQYFPLVPSILQNYHVSIYQIKKYISRNILSMLEPHHVSQNQLQQKAF